MPIELPIIYINNYTLVEVVTGLIVNWYWILLPFIFWPYFKKAWLLWRQEAYEKKRKYMFLEMIIPRAIEKPISSMEHVMSNMWSIHSSIQGIKNFKKKWIIGKRMEYFCFEVVSDGPVPRFFIRVSRDHVDTTKAAFYAQYPGIEFREVREDYTAEMAWDVPEKDWNLYGLDEVLSKDDCYPIKTYTQFFEMKPENIKDEKRIDPVNTLLESLGQLRADEKIWLQIRMAPVSKKESDHVKRGHELINKLVNRKVEEKKSTIFNILNFLGDSIFSSSNPNETKKENRELIPPEMKLTPREREIVSLIENKIGKNAFQTNIRAIYFGRGKVFNPSRKNLIESYFSSFSTPDQNEFGKMRATKTKILHFIVKRRLKMRKRKIFRMYIMRETPLYPKKGGTFILNTEELATIFHPPIELSKTSIRTHITEVHKSSAPLNLPY